MLMLLLKWSTVMQPQNSQHSSKVAVLLQKHKFSSLHTHSQCHFPASPLKNPNTTTMEAKKKFNCEILLSEFDQQFSGKWLYTENPVLH